MFTHVTVGSNNLDRSRKFYDAVFTAIGHKASDPANPRPMYRSAGGGMFLVLPPRDGKPATHANGGTIGFQAPNRKAVNEFHKNALAQGGKCEGPPGPREFAPNAYAAYVRDPDGNKLGVFCYNPE